MAECDDVTRKELTGSWRNHKMNTGSSLNIIRVTKLRIRWLRYVAYNGEKANANWNKATWKTR